MFIDLARTRRSIRKYKDTAVEKSKIDLLVETVLRAPSSKGSNAWEFVVVEDRETIQALSKSKPHGAAFLKDAPLAVVVAIDTSKSEVWVEDAAIAATYLHLAATDLGLGSCWIQLRLRDHEPQKKSAGTYAAEILGLRPGLEVAVIVAMGYPAEEKAPHPTDKLKFEQVHYNRFGRKYS